MNLILGLIVGLLGLLWGSFLGVVVYRTVNEGSPLSGRSRCDKCKKKLSWWQNIPLISFLLLRGKCFYCKKPIDWSYPLIESITAVLFVWWFVVGRSFFLLAGSPWSIVQPVFWLVVGMALLVVFLTDLKFGVISDGVNLFLFSWVLFYRLILVGSGQMMMADLLNAVLSAIVLTGFFYCLWWFTKKKGFGFGDVKFAPSIGLLLGWPRTLVGVMAGFIIGSVVGILLIFWGKKKFGQTIPFGPFLVVGIVVALLWGNDLWNWYMGMLQ
ncbi:prepilin peptidase [Patescibacteria group bacterium]|nr:prepilin peptidase [Patescibacteria group bacterium]MBU1256869.1 prepilin peptidase [Patescibacteria group bacterium]